MAIASIVSLVILSPRRQMRGTVRDFRDYCKSQESPTNKPGYSRTLFWHSPLPPYHFRDGREIMASIGRLSSWRSWRYCSESMSCSLNRMVRSSKVARRSAFPAKLFQQLRHRCLSADKLTSRSRNCRTQLPKCSSQGRLMFRIIAVACNRSSASVRVRDRTLRFDRGLLSDCPPRN